MASNLVREFAAEREIINDETKESFNPDGEELNFVDFDIINFTAWHTFVSVDGTVRYGTILDGGTVHIASTRREVKNFIPTTIR